MNIAKELIDDVNAVIKISVSPEDYETRVAKKLQEQTKKLTLKGFRPGKVPANLAKKLIGKNVLIEEVNGLIFEKLDSFIKEEKLDILGEPLLSKDHKPLDIEFGKDFEYSFDIGMQPKIDFSLSADFEVPYHNILVSDELIEKEKQLYADRYGKQIEASEVSTQKELVHGDFSELDASGNIVENGVLAENSVFSLEYCKDDITANLFAGKKVGDKVVFNPASAFPNDTDRAQMLGIDKDNQEAMKADYEFTINKIERFASAEINQELFDKVYGENVITSEEEFVGKLKAEIQAAFNSNADYKMLLDAKEKIQTQLQINLPGDFLKRWMVWSKQSENKPVSEEEVAASYPALEDNLKWQLIQKQLIEQYDLKISEEEYMQAAMTFARAEFVRYGLPAHFLTDDFLKEQAKRMLESKEQGEMIYSSALDSKLVEVIKTNATLTKIDISFEDFKKLSNNEEGNDDNNE